MSFAYRFTYLDASGAAIGASATYCL